MDNKIEYNEADLYEIQFNQEKINKLKKSKKNVKRILLIVIAIPILWFLSEASNNSGNDAYGFAFLIFGPIVGLFIAILFSIVSAFFEIPIKKYKKNIEIINSKYNFNDINNG